MGNTIKTSQSVSLETKHQEVYEFSPLSRPFDPFSKKKKVSLLFVNRGKKELWKSDQQRDKIFASIYAAESGLKARTLIEVRGLNETGEYEYSYRKDGKLLCKNVVLNEPKPSDAVDVSSLQAATAKPTYYKVQELSLRTFKQVALSHAIVEFLKAIIEFLATPFAYLYQLIAGQGEPRRFASMLVPVEHDKVGEITHATVLSQMQFMSKLLAEEDQTDHSKELGLTPIQDSQIYFAGIFRPCRETNTHYQIWIGPKEPTENKNYQKKYRDRLNQLALGLKQAKENGSDVSLINKLSVEIKRIEQEGRHQQTVLKPEKLIFNKDDPCLQLPGFAAHAQQLQGDPKYVEVILNAGMWLEIEKEHPTVQHAVVQKLTSDLTDEEKNPKIVSGVQQAALIFREGHALGKEMHEALNSGNKKRAEKVIQKLSLKLQKLHESKHLILPLAQGEGREYLPHFLVFVYEGNKILLKHICLSSTTLDKGKIQVVTTYDITDTMQDPNKIHQFARSLFAMQPYARGKDAREIKLKGPFVRDVSLDSLILNFGSLLVANESSIEKKASRDPVKALLTVIQELKISEVPHLAPEFHTLERITASKAQFYTVYVNHLISYYEEKEARLLPSERAHALEGILWYAKQVHHYIGNEVDADTALAISEHLTEFVTKKLDELQRTEKLEQKDTQNLQNKASLFRASLSVGIEDAMRRMEHSKNVEGSRVSVKEWTAIRKLQNDFQKTTLSVGDRAKVLKRMRNLQNLARAYLKEGDFFAAKTFLLGILQALPPPDDEAINKTFWGSLNEGELSQWVKELESLSEKMMEACLRSNTYPMKPHEVFEFNVVVPLIQRYLLQRVIPFKLQAIDGPNGYLKTYKNDRSLVDAQGHGLLENERQSFIKMRAKEIEVSETHECQRRWEKEDKEDYASQENFGQTLRSYQTKLNNYEKHKDDPNQRMYYPHPGQPPSKPVIRKEVNDRKKELTDAIQHAKNHDKFMQNLNAIDVKTLDLTWDHWLNTGDDRTIAVLGKFAHLMRIPAHIYAYKMGNKPNGQNVWVGQTFDSIDNAIWLMNKDCSVLVGSSPAFEKRYGACKRILEKIKSTERVSTRQAMYFSIGYSMLGDGSQMTSPIEEQELESKVAAHQEGYFNPGEGGCYFVPEEMASIRKVDEMRKILREPVDYLIAYNNRSGIKGTITNALAIGSKALTRDQLRTRFRSMSEIHLVASTRKDGGNRFVGCFTLSNKAGRKGSIATNRQPEKPATHVERRKYMGQVTPEMASEKVGGDNERQVVDDVGINHLYKQLDPAEEFILRETALAKARRDKSDELSYLTISQCMHFIYQYPEKLEIPQVQHTLHKNFFQQGLIKKHVKDNPEFFVRFGKILHEVCTFLQSKGDVHRVSELFIREVCERIRRQTIELKDDLEKKYGEEKNWVKEISDALPSYNEDNIVGTFRNKMDSSERKVFATFALSYYCHKGNGPSTDNIDAMRDLLNAFCILQQYPFESGHSGLQAELLYEVQKNLLPKIALRLSQDEAQRNHLLNQLTGKVNAIWTVNSEKSYIYTTVEAGKTFEVDIRTGRGFNLVMQQIDKCKLPEQIRSDPNFQFLFQNADPLVVSIPAANGITEYRWQAEKSGGEFLLRYRQSDHSVQIYQVVQGKEYLFQKLDLNQSSMNKLWQLLTRHGNKTIENMITSKGVWVYIDEKKKQSISKVILAQHGLNLEKDPITLNISGSKITGATVGKGRDKKWICAGLSRGKWLCSILSNIDNKLLSFHGGGGLLLLSKDKVHVDEIRFPLDPTTKEQLILKKSEKNSEAWVVSGREDWVWQLSNTKTYEKRFGKNWREYILPLKNQRSGEEEIWIFPHMVLGSSKHGGGVKFLKSALDFFDAVGGSLDAQGLGQNIDVGELRALVGVAESFTGGLDNLLDQAQDFQQAPDSGAPNEEQNDLVGILKSVTNPHGIRYRIGHKSETSSHAGFLYLAHVASLQGDWGTASRYLQLMQENGSSSAEELKQLQKMITVIFGAETLFNQKDSRFTAKNPLEAAFKAKASAAFMTLNTRLKAQHGLELFEDKAFEKTIIGGGGVFYSQYRQGIATHRQRLEDNNLLLTKREETLLSSDLTTMTAALEVACNEAKGKKAIIPEPFQLQIPTPTEMTEMIEAMADYVQPYGVWSMHDLHKTNGTYPKWETVLANFWVYWEWIQTENIQIEDIAFLMRHLPPLKENATEKEQRDWQAVETARRTLLLFWHYCKQERYAPDRAENSLAQNAVLREVKARRLDMPNFAGMEGKKRRLKQGVEMSPSIFRAFYAKGYSYYLEFRRRLNSYSYKEKVGGVEHARGVKLDFIQASKSLLHKFLAQATAEEKKNHFVIHPGNIDVAEAYQPPKVAPKLTQVQQAKADAWADLKNLVRKSYPFAVQIFEDNKKTIQPVFSAFLDLPDFEKSWIQIEALFLDLLKVPGIQFIINSMKNDIHNIYDEYAQVVGYPNPSPYPKKVEKGEYEPVEVQPKGDQQWGKYFIDSFKTWNHKTHQWETNTSVWDTRKNEAKKYFNPEQETSVRKKHKLEKICEGIDEAAEDLKKRTESAFQVGALKETYGQISSNLKQLRAEDKKLRGQILDFVRSNAQELGLMYLFTKRDAITDEQIIQRVYDLYRYGQLGRLDDEHLQVEFAELITESILTATEMQQYEKARGACKDLATLWRDLEKSLPDSFSGSKRAYELQNRANRSADWLLHSADLKRFLEEGADRLRYTEEVDGKHMLKDQKFARRYLVSDVRNQWISRKKAISGLEALLKDMLEKGKGKPLEFIKVRMGMGKTDFIFPEAIDLLIQLGRVPIMVTTDDLVDQLKISMGDKAFVFKFSIDFGLDIVHAHALGKLDGMKRKEQWAALNKPESVEEHLKTLIKTLENLKAEGKAVLTSPSQIAALRNKRVQMQEILDLMHEGEERSTVFNQVELLKQIEGHFKQEQAIYLIDEEINGDISSEFNFAEGDYRTVDPVRFEVAEKLMRTIQSKHPNLWEMIVNNNLRAIRDVAVEFRGVAHSLFQDVDFWKDLGWNPAVWQSINEEEFCDFILGTGKALPKSMPSWNLQLSPQEQQEKSYVGALKKLLSQTMDSVRGINPKLERGISSINGVTVVPFSDGNEKPGILYGEESENLLHHMLYYAGVDTKIGEEIFLQKDKDLSGLDVRISPLYSETWKDWGNHIGTVYNRNRWSKDNPSGYKNRYEAFVGSPELALERVLFLRHMMLETDFIRIFVKQITFNSQDLGIGVDTRFGSGTGHSFALNKSDYLDDTTDAPDPVLGETLLCLDLNRRTTTFTETPLEYIEKKAQDLRCHGILNYDHEVLGNDCEKLAARLRSQVNRQMIYRVQEDQQLVKKIWNTGEHFFPMGYEPEAIDPNTGLFLFSRKDSRGVHFHIPRGGDKYGELILGAGNQMEEVSQAAYRWRFPGMGHEIHFSHDQNTREQICKACDLKSKDPITIGHAMRYFALNTLEEEDIKNLKAVIFKEQTALKTYVDAVVRKPYDLTNMQNSSCMEELEGKVVCKSVNRLYTMTMHNNWEKEYQAQKTTDPVSFVKGLCEDELKKIAQLDALFIKKTQKFIAKHPDAQLVRDHALLGISLIKKGESWEKFEQNLTHLLLNFKGKANEHHIAVAREILRKFHGMRIAFEKAEDDVRKEQQRLQDPKYQEFLCKNLDENISVDLDAGARNEQRIQQQQEQQREQKQEKMQRVMVPGKGYGNTQSINFEHFKKLALGKVQIQGSYRCYWDTNGNVLPLATVLEQELKFKMPGTEYKNIYISHRAWQLLQKMGHMSVPAVEMLVVQDPKGVPHTVLITPTEMEETVAKAMVSERASSANAVPYPYSEETVWNALKEAFFMSLGNMEQKLEDNKSRCLPYFLECLDENHVDDAVIKFYNNMPEIAKILGLNQRNLRPLEKYLRDIHRDWWFNVNTDRMAVYPLSNESFSRMHMDCVQEPNEKTETFTHMMVMVNIFLNWTQYPLKELEYLIQYVHHLDDTKAESLINTLTGVHGKEKYIDSNNEEQLKASRTIELIKKIRAQDPEWVLSVALRKLNANYPKDKYRPEQLKALEKWVKEMPRDLVFQQELRKLETLKAKESIELLKAFRRGKAN